MPEGTARGRAERGTHSMVKEFKNTRVAEDGDYRRDWRAGMTRPYRAL